MRPWGRRVGWCACALGVVGCGRSIPVCPWVRRVRSCAFHLFRCAMGVVWFVRVRAVHSRAPWGSTGSFVCVRSITFRPGVRDRSVRLVDFRAPSR